MEFAFRTLGKVRKSEAAARIAEEQERQRKAAEEAAVLEMQKRMEAERQAEKERAAAEKKRQKALAAAERERQRRINAEQRAAEAQKRSEKQAGQNRWLKIAAVVLCAVLLVGGAVGVGAYVKQQAELARITEEQRLHELEQQKEKLIQQEEQRLNETFEINLTDGGYFITNYNGDGGDVVIPATYMGEPVVRIGSYAFGHYGFGFSSNNITSITIPDSVTSIDNGAFYGCNSLTSIDIPDSVTSIGANTFSDCTVTVTAPHEASYYGYTPNIGVTWVVED